MDFRRRFAPEFHQPSTIIHQPFLSTINVKSLPDLAGTMQNVPESFIFVHNPFFMEVNDALVEHLCKLANLEFDEAGMEEIKKDLEKMIGFVDKLNALDVSGVEPLLYMGEETDTLREDIFEPSISRADALKNAAKADKEYFRVPRVVKNPSA
jgi:aspartyl-tRNA(Asn)/glutamyl-tRNA(Gln) amidotransferase subunit C